MKNIRTLVLASILVLGGRAMFSQNITDSTIKWNSTTTYDIDAGITTAEESIVVSFPDHIEWQTSDGVLMYTFTIVKTEGSWLDIRQNGQISYDINQQQGKSGSVQFMKDSGGTHIRFALYTDSAPEIFELAITNTQSI